MAYCETGEEATVTYISKAGVKSQFVTKNTPIHIECGDKQRTGKFIYTLIDYGYIANCESSGQMFTDEIIADSYQAQNTTNPGLFERCPWYQVTFFIGTEQVFSAKKTSRYAVLQRPNPNYSPGDKILTIKNAQSTKLFEAEVKNCEHTVACGDQCPPNHIRCKCNAYPGYCCIPCSEIKSGIAAATAAVRGMNYG